MTRELAGKTLAGIVLGGPLAFALCGLYGYLGPGSLLDKYVVVLFLLLPVWAGLFSLALACRSCARAWGWLVWGNAAGFGALMFTRQWLH